MPSSTGEKRQHTTLEHIDKQKIINLPRFSVPGQATASNVRTAAEALLHEIEGKVSPEIGGNRGLRNQETLERGLATRSAPNSAQSGGMMSATISSMTGTLISDVASTDIDSWSIFPKPEGNFGLRSFER